PAPPVIQHRSLSKQPTAAVPAAPTLRFYQTKSRTPPVIQRRSSKQPMPAPPVIQHRSLSKQPAAAMPAPPVIHRRSSKQPAAAMPAPPVIQRRS
ncbi:MAG: hypothetical protein LBB61_05550, partial [Treponema sp.]|nr:hypothetical protein [Treponema sp.]